MWAADTPSSARCAGCQGESFRIPLPRGPGVHFARWDTPLLSRPATPGINRVGNSDAQLCMFVSRCSGRVFLCGVSGWGGSASGASLFVSEARPSASGASPFVSGPRCRASRPAGLGLGLGLGLAERIQVLVSPRSRKEVSAFNDTGPVFNGCCRDTTMSSVTPCPRTSGRTDPDVRPDVRRVRRVVRPRCDTGPAIRHGSCPAVTEDRDGPRRTGWGTGWGTGTEWGPGRSEWGPKWGPSPADQGRTGAGTALGTEWDRPQAPERDHAR